MREAIRPIEDDYRTDVRELVDEALSEVADSDDLRERLDESVDSSWWVTYTRPSQFVLLCSDNADAYAEELGADGMVKDGSINWAALAYMAMRADADEYAQAQLADRKCVECDEIVWGPLPEELICEDCKAERVPAWEGSNSVPQA